MPDNGYGGFRYSSAPSSPVRHKRRVRAGVCRFCGCTAKRACILIRPLFDDDPPVTCRWADETKTLCTAPKCLRADVREKRAAAKVRK